MQEDQQRMDQMRKVYHRAISIPLNNIEQIWKEYDAFENGLSRLTVRWTFSILLISSNYSNSHRPKSSFQTSQRDTWLRGLPSPSSKT